MRCGAQQMERDNFKQNMYSYGSNPVGGALVGVMLPLDWPGRLKESSFQNL